MPNCSSCGARIKWIKTPAGKWMICNEVLVPYKANDAGKDRVVDDRGNVIKCDLDFGDQQPDGMARVPHWATCPNADQHRKRGRS